DPFRLTAANMLDAREHGAIVLTAHEVTGLIREGATVCGVHVRMWTLNYDEIDMVLEGELHVRHEGETMIAKAGDVMFIPKGSSIE
ncbi:cupin domain-containing protein, partial [Salmonella enterica subsp. enterica serovar Montevideo]|nr:cupin domain-containing protein [Salmonella enterica subsp. enterica serovar Montevideo]